MWLSKKRLPDLVLGVGIRADVDGARRAARDMRRAIGQEFARSGGFGLTGIGPQSSYGAPAGAAGTLLGAGLTGLISGQMAARALLESPEWTHYQAQQYKEKLLGRMQQDPKLGRGLLMADATKKKWDRIMGGGGRGGGGQPPGGGTGAVPPGGKGWWAGIVNAIGLGGVWSSKKGLLGNLATIRNLYRLVWVFMVSFALGSIIRIVAATTTAALRYIRNTGTTTGRYGRFSNAAEATPSALRNVSVQFGLLLIEVLKLDEVLGDFNHTLVQLGSVFGWIGEQKKTLAIWRAAVALANPLVFGIRGWNWLLNKLPTGAGGVNLGAGGLSSKMAPAALQGSVQAYSILQGNLLNYAAATARNTKQTVDALNKIIERAPQMGVVAG